MSNEKQYTDDEMNSLMCSLALVNSRGLEVVESLIAERDALIHDIAGYVSVNTELVNENEQMKTDFSEISSLLKNVTGVNEWTELEINEAEGIASKYSEG